MAARLLVCVSVLLVGLCDGCGMVTHSLVAHRALTQFYQTTSFQDYAAVVKKHPDSVIAGAPFPDYLYECGPVHDHGEDAHWPPFQAAAAKYIRETFPDAVHSGNADAEKLIAFFFGVVSHSIADISWHGMGTLQGYGLIETIGAYDYNGTGGLDSLPHTMADTGGEFLASRQVDLSWFQPLSWSVPTQHIINIFALINDTVNATDIEKCQAIFTAGSEAVKYLADIVTLEETDPSPSFQDHYLTMMVGGVDDMAVWSGVLWDRFSSWISSGPPSPLPPFEKIPPSRSSAARLARLLAPMMQKVQARHATDQTLDVQCELLSEITRELTQPHKTDDIKELESHLISVGLTHTHIQNKHTQLCTQQQQQHEAAETATKPVTLNQIALWTGSHQWGYFGSSISVGNTSSGSFYVAMGSPGDNAPIPGSDVLYPYAGSVSLKSVAASRAFPENSGSRTRGANVLMVEDEEAEKQGSKKVRDDVLRVEAQEWYARMGAAVLVADLNCDGIDDLVASMPTAGWNWNGTQTYVDYSYHGKIEIFFGPFSNSPLSGPLTPNVTIHNPGIELMLYGEVLTTFDIDQDGCLDLIVGSPNAQAMGTQGRDGAQVGHIHIFVSTTISGGSEFLTVNNASLYSEGSSSFEHFGASIAFLPSPPESSVLMIIGSPGHRCKNCAYNGVSSTGKITGISLEHSNGVVTGAEVFSIEGTVAKARFGSALAVSPEDSIVAVSAPSVPVDSGLLANRTYGKVWMIDVTGVNGLVSIDSLTSVVSLTCNTASLHDSRFGSSLLITPLPTSLSSPSSRISLQKQLIPKQAQQQQKQQQQQQQLKSLSSIQLIVGAPLHSTVLSADFGSVFVYSNLEQGTHITDCVGSAHAQASGSSHRVRFGSVLAVADVNGDGKQELLVGAPREDVQGAEMAGAVHVFEL